MIYGEPAPYEAEIAAICGTFNCTPDKAVELRGPAWRDLTRDTMDAIAASRLRAEHDAKQTESWTARDHEFWRELTDAVGMRQPPLRRLPDGDSS